MRNEKAVKVFRDCKNCTEAVLRSFDEKIDMDIEIIKNLASGFRNGMFTGDVCGAIAGAVMVIGLVKNNSEGNGIVNRFHVGRNTKRFQEEFKKKYGTLNCIELRNLAKKNCDPIVSDVVKILESIV